MTNALEARATGTLQSTMTPVVVALDSFVLRQTPESKYSHFSGSWERLVQIAAKNLIEARQVDGETVLAVPACPDLHGEIFHSGVVSLVDHPEVELRTEFSSRRPEKEAPYLQTVAVGRQKAPAEYVEVIVYSRARLESDDPTEEFPQDVDYFIVSINASLREGGEPPTPQAIARNLAARDPKDPRGKGGTPREYTTEELMESILFWSQHVMCG